MATPEISYRCALCGAAIRPGAQSCPNCGEPETRPAPPVTRVIPPEPNVATSWLMQPDLGLETAAPPTAEAVLVPPVYTPAPTTPPKIAAPPSQTEAPILEIPPVLEEAEPDDNPMLLLKDATEEVAEEAAPNVDESPALPAEDEPTAEEKLAQIKKSTPAVKVLEGPHKSRKRRRSSRLTLRERLTGRLAQLRSISLGASLKMAPTVDQLRHTSNAVLDRASDDPSARFLLVGLLLVSVAAFVFFVTFFMG